MKSFKQFVLNEMPLNPDLIKGVSKLVSSDKWEDIEEKFREYCASAEPAYSQFRVGDDAGATRQPVIMPVLSKLFSRTQLSKMRVKKLPETFKTVIKFAINDRNRQFNIWEYNRWYDAKNILKERIWFCPIIDTSDTIFKNLDKQSRNKKIALPDAKYNRNDLGPKFLQMPFCESVGDHDKLKKICIKTFGTFSSFSKKGYIYSFMKKLEKLEDGWSKRDIISEFNYGNYDIDISNEQMDNIKSLAGVIKKYNIDDLHEGNLGIYKNHLVIIDYAGYGGRAPYY